MAAGTRTWTGAIDDKWSTIGNWSGGSPQAGDDLVFPSGASNAHNINDLPADTEFVSLSFSGSGYALSGNRIVLSGGISNTVEGGSITIDLPIRLSASQTFVFKGDTYGGAIDLQAYDLRLMSGYAGGFSASVTLTGDISGTGSVRQDGSFGAVILRGTNGYTGVTETTPGTTYGAGLLIFGSQPDSAVTFNSQSGCMSGTGSVGSLFLAGYQAVLAPGTNCGGGDTGLLTTRGLRLGPTGTFQVQLAGTTPGTQHDQVAVNGAIDLGDATLAVTLLGGYMPVVGQQFVIVDNDESEAVVGTFAGLAEGATLTASGAEFTISYASGTGNDVVLVCTKVARVWTGNAGANWSNAANWSNGVPAAGDTLVFPASPATLTSHNDLPAGTEFVSLSFSGSGYALSGNRIVLSGGISNTVEGGSIRIDLPIRLSASQTFVFRGDTYGGAIDLQAYDLRLLSGFTGGFSASVTLAGDISGTGSVRQDGSFGAVNLEGVNTYTGVTEVVPATSYGSSLFVMGRQSQSAVSFNAQGGTLGGSGEMGSVALAGNSAILAPVGASSRTAVLLTRSITFGSTAVFQVDIGGTKAGLQHDSLTVSGSVVLSGSTLSVQIVEGFIPNFGQAFKIIDNDLGDSVDGNFANLPEGTEFNVSGYPFRVTYVGGDGNDVVLRCVAGGETSISSVTPASGPVSGGTFVTISGTGFLDGATLTFGGNAASNVNVIDEFTMTLTTPPHEVGTVDVVIVNPNTQTATLTGGFTYVSGPRVVVTATPSPMLQAEGTEGATTSWVLSNVGESSTTISLARDGSFFSQQPEVFTLAADESRRITITAAGRPVGSYAGRSFPEGDGVPAGLSVAVQLIVYGVPGAAVPDIVPERLRIDVEGPGPVLSGTVGFRNIGAGPATGVAASEAAWLIPDSTPVTVAPGTTVQVGFHVNRTFRENPDSTDSQMTTVRFVYPRVSDAVGKATGADAGSQPGSVIADTPRLATEAQGLGRPGPGQIGLSSPWIRIAATEGRRVVSDLVVSATSSFETMSLYTLDVGAACSTSRASELALAAGVSAYLANLGNPTSSERSFDLHLRTGMSRSITRIVQTVDDLRRQLSFLDGVTTRSTLGALPGECAFLTGLTAFERTTKIGVQEVGGGDTSVSIAFLDAEGGTLQTLGPMAVGSFGSVEQELTLDSRVMTARVTNAGSDGRVVARIEEATDGAEARSTIDDAYVCGASGSGMFVVPLVGAVGEATGVPVRRRPARRGRGGDTAIAGSEEGRTESTRLALFSPNGAEVELTLTGSGARSSRRTVTLGAGRTLVWQDVLAELFDVRAPGEGCLTLRVIGGKATLAAWREATGADGAMWNAWLPVIPVEHGLRAGQTRVYYGVSESAARSRESVPGAVRASLVLIESAGSPATVSVQIAASGRRSAASPIKTYPMAANEVVTIDDVVTAVLGTGREELGDLYNAGVFLTVTAGGGRVVPVIVTRAVRTGDRSVRAW